MKILNELTFTDVDTTCPKHGLDYYRDNYCVLFEKGFSEHLLTAKTKYTPAFYYYKGDSIIGVSLMHYGEYTEHEINLLNNFVNHTSIVYDIGANIGYHTLGLAQRAKHVYSFEANYKNFRLLDINCTHNHNITLYKNAVSSNAGITHIEDFELGSIGNFGECRIVDKGQEIEKITIDDLIKTNEIEPPSIVKIDVEGHEWEVIQGMSTTIKENLPIIFYEHMHGDDLPKIHEFLEQIGYTFYWFPVMNYNPNNFYNNKENIFGHGGVLNVLAVPFHIDMQTNLPQKLSSNETWEDAIKRLTKTNAKSD